MGLAVVGAGVGRTGTHSLKVALEQVLGGPCHHMMEMFGNEEQIAGWTDAIDGKPVDWSQLLSNYKAMVDWPGASFWRENLAANPDALVLLSTRNSPEEWYRSASKTIFLAMSNMPPEMQPWMNSVIKMLRERFSDQFDDQAAMMAAYERHNDEVRRDVPPAQLLEWKPADGWAPICERLGVATPSEPFPVTNTTDDFRAMMGLPPAEA